MLVRHMSDLEVNIVSVERIKEYSESPTEVIHFLHNIIIFPLRVTVFY